MYQFIAGEMRLPMTLPGKLCDAKDAVAIWRQSRAATFSIGHCRSRRSLAKHRERRELGIEVDDARRSHHTVDVEIGYARPGIVDIEIDMVTGNHCAHRGLATLGAKAVPYARRNDGDHSGAEHKRVRSVLLD